ncbi:hypothetical protein MRX96_033136 [Rhipicephalus microplus]
MGRFVRQQQNKGSPVEWTLSGLHILSLGALSKDKGTRSMTNAAFPISLLTHLPPTSSGSPEAKEAVVPVLRGRAPDSSAASNKCRRVVARSMCRRGRSYISLPVVR